MSSGRKGKDAEAHSELNGGLCALGEGLVMTGGRQRSRWPEEEEDVCRRLGNGGPQTCLPTAHSVAPPAALYGPSSPANTQDPREGPSLARRTTQDLLGGGLTRLAREGRRDQGKANLMRFQ